MATSYSGDNDASNDSGLVGPNLLGPCVKISHCSLRDTENTDDISTANYH